MSDIPDIIPPGQKIGNWVCQRSSVGGSSATGESHLTMYDLTVVLKAKYSFFPSKKVKHNLHGLKYLKMLYMYNLHLDIAVHKAPLPL